MGNSVKTIIKARPSGSPANGFSDRALMSVLRHGAVVIITIAAPIAALVVTYKQFRRKGAEE
jgi:hypothetical protein